MIYLQRCNDRVKIDRSIEFGSADKVIEDLSRQSIDK